MSFDPTSTLKSSSEWNGYVVSGKTREERRRRLEMVPEEWRASVKRHVETYFAIRKYHNDRAGRAKR
jgi:hypothetical protein